MQFARQRHKFLVAVPSHFSRCRRTCPRVPFSFATVMALSNSETAPSSCRISLEVRPSSQVAQHDEPDFLNHQVTREAACPLYDVRAPEEPFDQPAPGISLKPASMLRGTAGRIPA